MKNSLLLGMTLIFLFSCGVKKNKEEEVSSKADSKENVVQANETESFAQFQNESIDLMYNKAYEAAYKETPDSIESIKASDGYKNAIQKLDEKLTNQSIDQTQYDKFVTSLNGAIKLAHDTAKQVFKDTKVDVPEVNIREPQSVSDIKYSTAVALNIRSEDAYAVNCGNCIGQIPQNTKVSILSRGRNGYVLIDILDDSAVISSDSDYWVSEDFLSDKKTQMKVAYDTASSSKLKYFVIQNIATERLRVYKKGCDVAQKGCKHELVLDIPIVAGQPTDDKSTNTIVGNFYISKWWKFYEDTRKLYPSWYKSGYPDVPEKGANLFSWLDESVLPDNIPQAQARGAFGWYTAHLAPNAHAQWMHGTYGWGEESIDFIKSAKNFFYSNLAKMVGSATRSHGCSRMSNPAVAYLFEMLPVGTPVIKVYAKEAVSNPSVLRNRNVRSIRRGKKEFDNWNYMLTKRSDIMSSDKELLSSKNISFYEVIDEGHFQITDKPTLVETQFHTGVSNFGNLYNIASDDFKGTFYIDVGLLEDYRHPTYLTVGGKKELYPSNLEYKLK